MIDVSLGAAGRRASPGLDEEYQMARERRGVVSLWVFREQGDPRDDEKDVLKTLCGVDYYDPDFQEGVIVEVETPLRDPAGPAFLREVVRGRGDERGAKAGGGTGLRRPRTIGIRVRPAVGDQTDREGPRLLGVFDWHR
jgi:hypothetical protein